jgi:hypothetical protein
LTTFNENFVKLQRNLSSSFCRNKWTSEELKRVPSFKKNSDLVTNFLHEFRIGLEHLISIKTRLPQLQPYLKSREHFKKSSSSYSPVLVSTLLDTTSWIDCMQRTVVTLAPIHVGKKRNNEWTNETVYHMLKKQQKTCKGSNYSNVKLNLKFRLI